MADVRHHAGRRRVTVVLNGTTIIDNAEIPGHWWRARQRGRRPGPIMLRGDHTAIRYRNIRIVPAKWSDSPFPHGGIFG
jgi:hypothetical protein